MKKSAFLLLTTVWFLTLSSTKQEIVWLDKDLEQTSKSEAVYYIVGSNLEGEVTYFFKSKTMYRKVFYVNKKQGGKFHEYYESGELKEVGKYEDGLREGNWKVYYRNGKIRQKGKYTKGDKVGVWKTFYKNN
jgi:antitoxin component YwqK of YwqJK toxin-antitoxin module